MNGVLVVSPPTVAAPRSSLLAIRSASVPPSPLIALLSSTLKGNPQSSSRLIACRFPLSPLWILECPWTATRGSLIPSLPTTLSSLSTCFAISSPRPSFFSSRKDRTLSLLLLLPKIKMHGMQCSRVLHFTYLIICCRNLLIGKIEIFVLLEVRMRKDAK